MRVRPVDVRRPLRVGHGAGTATTTLPPVGFSERRCQAKKSSIIRQLSGLVTRPRNPDKAKYSDSYRTTAGFLHFVVENHDKQIVAKLNAAMRVGKYGDVLWRESTGKTVDELWREYVATLKK
jgi:hypothetical protein